MTLRTVTFNPATHKVVPVDIDETIKRQLSVNQHSAAEWEEEWALLLAAVPDTPPGVIKHDGEPVAIVRCDGVMGVHFTKNSDYGCGLVVGTELFTHAAPAQPVEQWSRNKDWVAGILLSVAEIPDRDSPTDQPEMMLVTATELENIIESQNEIFDDAGPQPVERQELSDDSILKMLADNEIGWMHDSGVRQFKATERDGQTYLRAVRAIIAADRRQA
jgi:hypothetical protein